MKKMFFLILFFLAISMMAHAYTEVDGFYGQTWLDYVDEDGYGGGNFGNGTESNPWQIRSAGALAYLARAVNNGETYEGKYFIIAANIDLGYAPSGTKLVWVPIGCTTSPNSDNTKVFKGTLTNGTDTNGKPYEITGMTIRAYSTATTNCFGLFGALRGTVNGLVLKNSNIYIDQTTDKYYAGTIAGYLGKTSNTSVSQRFGTIKNSTADQTLIQAKTTNQSTSIGGLVGIATFDINELKSNLAKSTMILEGPVHAGGVAGETEWETIDCHAVVDMTATNSTDNDCCLGGVVGYAFSYNSDKVNALNACTSSGEIKGNGSNIFMGGVIGYSEYYLNMNSCTTCVSLFGGHTIGGLIGYCYSQIGPNGTMISDCYCNSFVDGSNATYAGGLMGYVDFYQLASDTWITPVNNTTFTYFAGTMKKPEESENYGCIVGYVNNFNPSSTHPEFGFFYRDYRQCNLQLDGCGWGDDSEANSRVVNYFTPHPVDGDFCYDNMANRPQMYMRAYHASDIFYKDNMVLASIPFNVTGDGENFFDVWDSTVDFQIGTFKNRSTAEEIATFSLPAPPSCVDVEGNTVKVLDPGEMDVFVNYHGLQRKVHVTSTYGVPWNGRVMLPVNYNDYFAGGDGTAAHPYVIHNAHELLRVMANGDDHIPAEYRYNMAGKHYILANDIFINTHLLGEDELPTDGAMKWYGYPWHGVLHGNGKTIYGLYVDKENVASAGLITILDGSVTDLAIVDSYVKNKATGSGDLCAGLLCGTIDGGKVERCMVHGRVQVDGYAGGISGKAGGDGSIISDCFSSVHLGWVSQPGLFHGAGLTYTSPETVQRCVSTGKVESYNQIFGLTMNEGVCTDSWYDRQMMSEDVQTYGNTCTKDMISGQILNNASAWKNEENRYPMLKQFANTNYGDLLSMAVRFADGDRAGSITQIFDFPTENVRWWARTGDYYLDVINECGAASPNGQTGIYTEHLLAETINSKSECTKGLKALAVNVLADKAGIQFEDQNAESAAIQAFDNNDDNLVTLREAFEATTTQFNTFNQHAADVEKFNEMRYFAGLNILQTNMISGLTKLKEITLPSTITTIATNAFNGCESLEEVELPHLFLTLQEGGFYGSAIKNIWVSPKNARCQSIDGALYLNDLYDEGKVMLMAYPPARGEENATISAPLSSIMSYAIYKVPGLKNVYIDNCLPEGEIAKLEEDGIIHEDENDLMHVYVNDGSFNSQLFMDYYNDDMWGELYYDEGHLHIYYPLKVTSAMWSTIYIDFPTQLPEGLKAYIADYPDEEEKIVEVHSIGRIIPRSTPVAIKAELAGLYPLYKYEGTVPDVNKWENRFVGSFIGQDGRFGVPVNQETANEGSILTLGRNRNGVVGFYKYTGTDIPPYRAYLTRNNIIEGVSMRFGTDYEDEITGIHSPDTMNGISEEEIWYSLDGRRLNDRPSQRGIYIVNGKKIVVK